MRAHQACEVAAHQARDPRWLGDPKLYQREALLTFAAASNREVLPWSWVEVTCELPNCLTADHMVIHSPTFIDYPRGVCVYCGNPSGTRDHLLPKPNTGAALRRLVAVVPACADCNSRINDALAVSVTERRAIAHASIERKYRNILSVPDKSEAEMAELGPALRSVARKNNNLRAWVRARLTWPTDPDYDLRAFQRTGIEFPAQIGLI